MSTLLTGRLAGWILGKAGELVMGAGGNFTHEALKELWQDAGIRLGEGGLPANHNLDSAMAQSLGKSVRLLAYSLHAPRNKSLLELLENVSDWPTIARRLAERLQGNIIPNSPEDYWLFELIDATQSKGAFMDFDARLNAASPALLVRDRLDLELQRVLPEECLKWTKEMVKNPHRHPLFDDSVRNGWKLGPDINRKVTFYGAFCLFFREEVKINEIVFRAFMIRLNAQIDEKLDQLLKRCPTEQDQRELRTQSKNIRGLQLKDIEKVLNRQNENLLHTLLAEFKKVHHGIAELKEGQQRHARTTEELLTQQGNLSRTTREIQSDLKRSTNWIRFGGGLSILLIGVIVVLWLPRPQRQMTNNRVINEKRMKVSLDRLPPGYGMSSNGGGPFGRAKEIAHLNKIWRERKINLLNIWGIEGMGQSPLIGSWCRNFLDTRGHGAERVFTWSFDSLTTDSSGAASSDSFLAEALKFFGDPIQATNAAPPDAKAERLADLIAERPSLLLLEGLGTFQLPSGPLAGHIQDLGIRVLLQKLAQNNQGLCVVTARRPLPEIARLINGKTEQWMLGGIPLADGIKILQELGVSGSSAKLGEAVERYQNHPLSLELLGRHLVRAHEGKIDRLDRVDFRRAEGEFKLSLEERTNSYGHAFGLMTTYEAWLMSTNAASSRQLALLRLLGFFDGPADVESIMRLATSGIPTVTESLVNLSEIEWNTALHSLTDCGLISLSRDDPPLVDRVLKINAHPFIREYFASQMQSKMPTAWSIGQRRLGELLLSKVPAEPLNPKTREGIEFLYRAATCFCKAGDFDKALYALYLPRISNNEEGYATRRFGVFGHELTLLRAFYEEPWDRVAVQSEADVVVVLRCTAFCLAALGRREEAQPLFRRALELAMKLPDHSLQAKEVALIARNLANFSITWGNLEEATSLLETNMPFADKSPNRFFPVGFRTSLAYGMLLSDGPSAHVMKLFDDALEMDRRREKKLGEVLELPAFHYHEALVAQGEWEKVLKHLSELETNLLNGGTAFGRAVRGLARASALSAGGDLNGAEQSLIAVEPVIRLSGRRETRARMELVSAEICLRKWETAPSDVRFVEKAREHIRHAEEIVSNNQLELLRCEMLLLRGWLAFVTGEIQIASTDLAAAEKIAKAGNVRLRIADVRLRRAVLFRNKTELDEARRLIESCNYGRRRKELKQVDEIKDSW